MFPRIIHLIYIPWDKHQKLKSDQLDFDQSFYHSFQARLGSRWNVKMWTWNKIEQFMNSSPYLDEWTQIKGKVSRPVMLVDY